MSANDCDKKVLEFTRPDKRPHANICNECVHRCDWDKDDVADNGDVNPCDFTECEITGWLVEYGKYWGNNSRYGQAQCKYYEHNDEDYPVWGTGGADGEWESDWISNEVGMMIMSAAEEMARAGRSEAEIVDMIRREIRRYEVNTMSD